MSFPENPQAKTDEVLPPLSLEDIEKITTQVKVEKGDQAAAAEARGLLDA